MSKYIVTGFFGKNYTGTESSIETDDWSKVEKEAHEMLAKGDFVEIKNTYSGGTVCLEPDAYFEMHELGQFPVDPDEMYNIQWTHSTSDGSVKDEYNVILEDGTSVTCVATEEPNDQDTKIRIYVDSLGEENEGNYQTRPKIAEQKTGEAIWILSRPEREVPDNVREWAEKVEKTANEMIKKLEQSGYKSFEMETAAGV